MRLAFMLFILFNGSFAFGQNLVPNPSFDDINVCPEFHRPCSPSGWFYVNHLVTQYSISEVVAISGENCLNFMVVDTGSANRHYWQTMLLCPVQAGKKYNITFKVAASYIGPNMNDVGILFTDSLLFLPADTLLQPVHYVNFTDARIRKVKKGWYEIQKEITATDSHQFIMIGNFSSKSNQEITEERKLTIKRLMLALDDLKITPSDEVLCPGAGHIKDSLYGITERHSRPAFRPAPVLAVIPPVVGQPIKVDTIVINNIEFDFDKFNIKNPDTLQYLRKYLTNPTVKSIAVIGFTDNKGTAAYNQDLSAKRAEAVAAFFIKSFGLDPAVLRSEGRGISITYPEQQRNRRVEIYLYH